MPLSPSGFVAPFGWAGASKNVVGIVAGVEKGKNAGCTKREARPECNLITPLRPYAERCKPRDVGVCVNLHLSFFVCGFLRFAARRHKTPTSILWSFLLPSRSFHLS